MANSLHRAAFDYPLPLVRIGNSIIRKSATWGGWFLATDFGDGPRVVFFGDDLPDLIRRLGEAGDVFPDGDGFRVD